MLEDTLTSLWTACADQRNLLIFALMAVGYICRQVEVIPNRLIPAILLVMGVIFGPMVKTPIYAGILHGITMAGLAVLLYGAVAKHIEAWIADKFSDKTDTTPKIVP